MKKSRDVPHTIESHMKKTKNRTVQQFYSRSRGKLLYEIMSQDFQSSFTAPGFCAIFRNAETL